MAVDFVAIYRRVRNGKVFLIFLFGLCVVWIVWNVTPGLPHFDDSDFGKLVTGLSIEASVGLSAYGAIAEAWRREDLRWQTDAERRDNQHAENLAHLRTILEAQSVTMRAVHDYIMGAAARAASGVGVEPGNPTVDPSRGNPK